VFYNSATLWAFVAPTSSRLSLSSCAMWDSGVSSDRLHLFALARELGKL